MGFFDGLGLFGNSSSQPQTGTKQPMGLLGNFDPETMGLLSMGAAMMQASGPSTVPRSFGQIVGTGLLNGMQTYNDALDHQMKRQELNDISDYRKAQSEQLGMKTTALRNQQDALGRITAGYSADPNFKPSMGDLLAIDHEAVIKGLAGGGVDFGLEPKVGINPDTNKPGYFIQDKRGNTKWIGAGVPDNFKLVPGNEYQGPQTFNPRDGTVAPINRPAVGQPSAGINLPGGDYGMQNTGGAVGLTPTSAGPVAPWANITSPKEQDQMKARVFEQDNKRLDDYREQVRKGKQIMADLNRFGELNRNQATGGVVDQFGMLPTLDSDKREMQAIVSRLGPQLRVPGSGSDSDLEQRLRLQALPGIDKPGDVNKQIRLQYQKQLQDAQNELAYREKYLVDYGHLNGVDEARAQAAENAKSGGLDVSQLPPEVVAYLKQQNPDAFNRGVARFNQNQGGQNQANRPKSKAIQLDGGGSAFASLGPDGHYYVTRNGKRYRVED
jgi:hypothetical protein